MNDDPTGPIVSVEPGDPGNDQMLARTKDDLRALLEITIHPLVDQAEAQDADLAAMMAVLVMSWMNRPDFMPRDRALSLLALTMFTLASAEREPTDEDGKTVRRG